MTHVLTFSSQAFMPPKSKKAKQADDAIAEPSSSDDEGEHAPDSVPDLCEDDGDDEGDEEYEEEKVEVFTHLVNIPHLILS
jgi:hypothetical protein